MRKTSEQEIGLFIKHGTIIVLAYESREHFQHYFCYNEDIIFKNVEIYKHIIGRSGYSKDVVRLSSKKIRY